MQASTEWFKDAKWGVLTHYLSGKENTAEDWNKRVDSFDTAGLARQLKSVGAAYYFITIGQNSGHYCSPNATYDSFVGIQPSKCSRRDLISDLHDALAPGDNTWERRLVLLRGAEHDVSGCRRAGRVGVDVLEQYNEPARLEHTSQLGNHGVELGVGDVLEHGAGKHRADAIVFERDGLAGLDEFEL